MASAKVGDYDILEAVATAGAKTIFEKLLAPYIGNGTLKSGAVKLIMSYFIGKNVSGKAGKIVSNALAIDGAEDVVTYFMSNGLGAQPANPIQDVL
jgi:hypothetical protein